MTYSTRYKILAAAAAGTLLLSLTGCTGLAEDPPATAKPTTTALPPQPTANPTERPGSDESLVGKDMGLASFNVYEVTRYTASKGCGCATEDGGPEIYPAGSQAILLRVTIKGYPHPSQKGRDTWNIPDLKITAEGWEGPAVSEESEGPERAAKAGLPWQPEGLFPGGAGMITNEVPASFAVAYYVPYDAQTLTLTLTGWQDPKETGMEPEPLVLEVPLEQVQLQ